MKKLSFYAAALTGACILPLAAVAQDKVPATPSAQGESLTQFSLGIQYQDGSNTGLYGRYNGFTKQGLDILGEFTTQRRDAWDSGNTWYYEFTGTNLDFQTGQNLASNFRDNTYTNTTNNDLGPMAELNMKVGDQGVWGINAGYDAISYAGNIIDSVWTVSGMNGTINNNFPVWGGAIPSPTGGTVGRITSYTVKGVIPAFEQFQTGTRRDILTFGGDYIFEDWVFDSNVMHEHKVGTLEQSLYASYGGEAFTMPVDYNTDRVTASAAYNDPDLQAVLQYTYSHFQDNNSAVALPRGISVAALSATSGPFAKTNLYSLPPSNTAHYVTGMLGYNLAPSTRITLNARGGVEMQNETFPANNADPYLSSTLGNPLYSWFGHLNSFNQGTSQTSPEDAAWVYQGNFGITSKLATDFNGLMTYSFDGRSVHLNQHLVWIGGTNSEATANTAAYVVPQDWFKQTAKAELSYRIFPESNTKITADYVFNDVDRTNAQVEHSITNTGGVYLTSLLGPDVLGTIDYEHANRSGDLNYGRPWNNLTTGIPGTPFGTPSGAYYQVPMTSNSITARVNYAAVGNVTGGVFLKYANENFHYAGVPNSAAQCAATPGCASGDWSLTGRGTGIRQDNNLTVGPDVNYRMNSDLTMHGYYTYEKIYYNNLGNGACAESNTGACAGSAGNYLNTYSSKMNTAGFSGAWQATSKLKIDAEYNMSSGAIDFGEYNGVSVTNVTATYQNVTSYPNINNLMHQVKVAATYQLASNIECSLLLQYSMFRTNDWNDVAAPVIPSTNGGSTIGIFNAGYPPPKYDVESVGTVLKMTL